jgi:hypothetical protein
MLRTLTLLCVLYVCMAEALAADVPGLRSLFEASFRSSYEVRHCGRNIDRFLRSAQAQGLNLQGAHYVKLTGSGFFELPPLQRRGSSAPGVFMADGLWYFHVILVADGMVFDFDFTNRPRVLPVVDYLREMFVPPGSVVQHWGMTIRYPEIMQSWSAETLSAEDYLESNEVFERHPRKRTLALGQWTRLDDLVSECSPALASVLSR